MKLSGLFWLSLTSLVPQAYAATSFNSNLETADAFAVLGASTVTNTGFTTIDGSLGVSPGTAITGFPPGIVINGTIHTGDAVAAQAQVDANNVYVAGVAAACDTDLTGQDLGGQTLVAGSYCFDTSAQLTGILTLDAQNDPYAQFLFQIGSTLTTASASEVQFINDAQGGGVFWLVGSSAILGTATEFNGNILSVASITLNTGANISCGRAIALDGAVTLDTNNVSINSDGCFSVVGVPEPSSATLLLLIGAPGMWWLKRRGMFQAL